MSRPDLREPIFPARKPEYRKNVHFIGENNPRPLITQSVHTPVSARNRRLFQSSNERTRTAQIAHEVDEKINRRSLERAEAERAMADAYLEQAHRERNMFRAKKAREAMAAQEHRDDLRTYETRKQQAARAAKELNQGSYRSKIYE